MYRVAVVDDDPYFIQEIESFIKQFSEEEGQQFTVSTFCDGRLLVDAYEKQFDLILLDIEMPNMNGMQAAEEIRKVDDNVVLMFITNMAQYAIHGYEV